MPPRHSFSNPDTGPIHSRRSSLKHGISSASSSSLFSPEDWATPKNFHCQPGLVQLQAGPETSHCAGKKIEGRLADLERRAEPTSASPDQTHPELAPLYQENQAQLKNEDGVKRERPKQERTAQERISYVEQWRKASSNIIAATDEISSKIENDQGIAARLYMTCLQVLRVICLKGTKSMPLESRLKALKEELGKLYLWGQPFRREELDYILEQSEDLRASVFALLSGIGTSILQGKTCGRR